MKHCRSSRTIFREKLSQKVSVTCKKGKQNQTATKQTSNTKHKHKTTSQKPRQVPEKCETRFVFLLGAAWVRSRAERPSVSYTKVTGIIARTGHNLQIYKKQIQKQISGSNKFQIRGDGKMIFFSSQAATDLKDTGSP